MATSVMGLQFYSVQPVINEDLSVYAKYYDTQIHHHTYIDYLGELAAFFNKKTEHMLQVTHLKVLSVPSVGLCLLCRHNFENNR